MKLLLKNLYCNDTTYDTTYNTNKKLIIKIYFIHFIMTITKM